MGGYATGKYSKAISDRSGQEFPYNEMVKEWNGSLVHTSEYEPKHPQIRRKVIIADRIAIKNSRTQDFQQPTEIDGVLSSSGGQGQALINLTLPGDFAFMSSGMEPDNGAEQNRRRSVSSIVGTVNVEIS